MPKLHDINFCKLILNVCYLFSAMVSPLISILANDKLNGENYVKWKSNMNAVLVCEDLKFVTTQPCPPQPAENARRTMHEAYQKWVTTDEKSRCYLLAGMSEVLATKHEAMTTATQILESL